MPKKLGDGQSRRRRAVGKSGRARQEVARELHLYQVDRGTLGDLGERLVGGAVAGDFSGQGSVK